MSVLQKIKLGTPPGGRDGDDNRVAHLKTNENFDVVGSSTPLGIAILNDSADLTPDDVGKRFGLYMPDESKEVGLPLASSVRAGACIHLFCVQHTVPIKLKPGDMSQLTSMNAGDWVTYVADGVKIWHVAERGRMMWDEVVGGKLSVGGDLSVATQNDEGHLALGKMPGYFYGNGGSVGWWSADKGSFQYVFEDRSFYVNGNLAVSGDSTLSGNIALGGSGKRIRGEFSGGPADVLFRNSSSNKSTLVGAVPSGAGNLAGWLGWSADLSKWAGVYYDGASSSGAFAVSNIEWRLIQSSVTKARVALDGSYYYGFAASNGLSNANLVAGNVGPSSNGLGISPEGAYLAIMNTANAGNLYLSKGPSAANSQYVQFSNAGGSIGSITALPGFTGVAYSTTSDYRLKDGLEPMTGALASVRKAKLYTGYFKSDPLRVRQDMVLAHEVAEIVSAAVSGQKDAVDYIPTYRDGYDPNDVQPRDILSIEQVIVPQQVDHSRLVLRLWGALQELATDFDAALSRIEKLEGSR